MNISLEDIIEQAYIICFKQSFGINFRVLHEVEH